MSTFTLLLLLTPALTLYLLPFIHLCMRLYRALSPKK